VNIFGVFRVKNHYFTPKNHIFSNLRGVACRVCPPGSAPGRGGQIKRGAIVQGIIMITTKNTLLYFDQTFFFMQIQTGIRSCMQLFNAIKTYF
jgi:hypothetical protein